MQVTAIHHALRRDLATCNLDGAHGLALLALLMLVALLLAGGAPVLAALRFERAAIAQGQAWRLLSGHFVHLGLRHGLADGAGLALLWALFARALAPRDWAWVLLGSFAAIDAGLWWLMPGLGWYAGLSGLLHGGWAAGSAAGAARRDPVSIVLLLALVLKLAWEELHGASLLLGGMPVVTRAHLYGAVGAALVLASLRMRDRARKPL
jgi:rhomboid family GlyGly-CTERM serine protease